MNSANFVNSAIFGARFVLVTMKIFLFVPQNFISISFACCLYLIPKFKPFIILIDKLLFKLIFDSKKVADNTARVLVYKVHHPLNTPNLSTDHQPIGYNIV